MQLCTDETEKGHAKARNETQWCKWSVGYVSIKIHQLNQKKYTFSMRLFFG